MAYNIVEGAVIIMHQLYLLCCKLQNFLFPLNLFSLGRLRGKLWQILVIPKCLQLMKYSSADKKTFDYMCALFLLTYKLARLKVETKTEIRSFMKEMFCRTKTCISIKTWLNFIVFEKRDSVVSRTSYIWSWSNMITTFFAIGLIRSNNLLTYF